MTGARAFFIKMSALTACASATLAGFATAQPLPAGEHAGCYAKIAYPPVYHMVTERIAGQPVISYRDIPPVVTHYAKQVLVAPARVEHETIAPVYRTTSHWIDVAGAPRTVSLPPVYRTITERRLISPAHLVWRRGGAVHGFAQGPSYGQGGSGQDDGDALRVHPTGEVLCRVKVPARYSWSRRLVLVAPARQSTAPGLSRHMEVHDRVLVQPSRTVEHTISAIYRTEDTTRVVHPASRQRIVSPGPVRTVSRRVLLSPMHYGWSPIVCTSPDRHAHAPPPAPASTYAPPAYGSAPAQAYRPDELLAPTPTFSPPQTLVPAPYDVGHPARR